MNITNKIVELFINLTKGESIATIGPPFSYYYSDITNNDIIIENCYNIDIRSAFPTICKLLFGINHPFVQKIYLKTDKKERNIFISTTLKEYDRKNNYNFLSDITLLSKLLIFCYAFTYYNNISILEYVKDGMYIAGNKNNTYNSDQLEFINITKEYDIQYHDDLIPLYLRFNKTSLYYKEDKQIIIKGKYKGLPQGIFDIINKFIDGHIYNIKLLKIIQEHYSELMFNIIYNGRISEYLKYLYEFENKKYLNDEGEFISNISEINPKSYLFNIIYPILNLFRIYNNQKEI